MGNAQLDQEQLANRKHPAVGRRSLGIALTVVFAIVAVLIRLIPFQLRPPNVAANGALSIFGGARTPIWVALPAQILALVVSDVILNQVFSWKPFNISVYVSFTIYLLLGRYMLRGNDSLGRITGVTFLGSFQFFLLTNFAEWLEFGVIGSGQKTYDSTLAGLLTCFRNALPFFGFTIAGDLGFSAALFGAEAWLYGVVHGTNPAEVPEESAS